MNRTIVVPIFAALLSFVPSVRADDASEAKLRENLKNVTLQLRTAQSEKAALQTTQADLDAKNKALDDQVKKQAKRLEELDKELKAEKEKAKEIQDRQTAQIKRLEDDLAKFKVSLDKWEAAHATITGIAKKKEIERAKLQAKAADLERKLADCRAKNAELYKLGNEILDRYNRFGIGEALAAREPFTGNAKVKLQNLVQDYGEKLLNQTPKP
jgi:chromosome segregation ATPase